jgi:hypothetical protein
MKATEGCWVATNDSLYDRPQIGRVREVHFDGSLDITLYSHKGVRIGRESPALCGPKGYEPCCSPERWDVIGEPDFNFIADKGFWGRHLARL